MKLTFGAMAVPANAILGQSPGRPGPGQKLTRAFCPDTRHLS